MKSTLPLFRSLRYAAVFLVGGMTVTLYAVAPLPPSLLAPGTSSPAGANVGASTAGYAFTVMLSAALNFQIQVTDQTTHTVAYTSTFVTFSNFGYDSITVPSSSLTTGHAFSWVARSQDSSGNAGAWSAPYYFSIDGGVQPTTYTISISASPNLGGTLSGSGSYASGASATVSAVPASGYSFSSWTEGGTSVSTSANYTFTVSANRTLVANFGAAAVVNYALALSASPANGGTVSGAGNYAASSSVTVTATPAAGFTFTGWSNSGLTLSTSSSYTFNIGGNASLVANFTQQATYAINTSSSPAGGGYTAGGGNKVVGSSVTVVASAANGYSFTNWTEGGAVVSTSSSYTFTANGNRTLVANFAATPTYYTLSVSASPPAGGTVGGAGTFAAGTNVTVTATPASGYVFTGWTNSGLTFSTSASYTFPIGGNANLVANFQLESYAITTTASPSAGGTTSGGGTKQAGTTVTVVATPAAEYNFSNWTEGGSVVSTNPTYSFTAGGDRTLVANFTNAASATYNLALSVLPVGGGTVTGGGNFAPGTNVTVTATAASGYTFTKWTSSGLTFSTTPTYSFPIGGNAALVANFTSQTTYAIAATVAPANGGYTAGGGNVVAGTTATMVASPAAGYTFVNWTENGSIVSTSPTYSFIASGARNLVANFKAMVTGYTLGITVVPTGAGTVTGAGNYTPGNTATVVATPAPGYNFIGWTSGGLTFSTSSSYSFPIGGEVALVANFAPSTYTISTGSAPNASGTTSGGGPKTPGSTVTVTAMAGAGYTFANWTENGAVVATTTSYTFAATHNRSLIANFVVSTTTVTIRATPSPLSGGTVSGSGPVRSGTKVTVSATPAAGYTFSSWSENGIFQSSSADYQFTAAGDRELVAVFESKSTAPGAFTLSSDLPTWNAATSSPVVRLSWTAAAGAGTYDIYRNGSLYAAAIPGGTTTFVDSIGLVVGKAYTYQIKANNPVGSSSTSPLSVAVPSTLRADAPDIALDSSHFAFSPTTAAPGAAVAVTLRVKNQGRSATQASNLRLSLKSTSNLAATDAAVFSLATLPTLQSSDSKDLIVPVVIPAGVPKGPYYLAAVADPANTLNDSDLTNNVALSADQLTIVGAGASSLSVTDPASQTVQEKAWVTFSVQATGAEPLHYLWFRGSIPIDNSDSPTLSFVATPTLDVMSYSVRVTDATGNSVSSKPALLGVKFAIPQTMNLGPQSRVILLGASSVPDPTLPTVVITHGWQPDSYVSKYDTAAQLDWVRLLADSIRKQIPTAVNIVMYNWRDAYSLDTLEKISDIDSLKNIYFTAGSFPHITSLDRAAATTPSHGAVLAEYLRTTLGVNYARPIQFIGHSLGSVVNAHAVSHLGGFANIQFTILDSPSSSLASYLGNTPEFFYRKLPASVRYFDNFYGTLPWQDTIGALALLEIRPPAVGLQIDGADSAGGWVLPGAGHSDVHDWYIDVVQKGSAHGVTEWRTLLRPEFDPKAAGIEWHPRATNVREVLPLQFVTVGNGGVVNSTPSVNGQTVAGYTFSSSAKSVLASASTAGRSDARALQSQDQSNPELARDLVIPPDAVTLEFDFQASKPGSNAWLDVTFNGMDVLRYSTDALRGDDFTKVSASVAQYAGQAGTFKFTLHANPNDDVQLTIAGVRFASPEVPVLVAQPRSQSVNEQDTVVLTTTVVGSGLFTYQWRKDGVPIGGATDAQLTIKNVNASSAGSYDVVVGNGVAASVSAPANISILPPGSTTGHLINLSILGELTAGETMTVGTVVGGAGTSGPKSLLFRAAGPTLSQYGVANALPAPSMTLFRGGGTSVSVVDANTGWNGSTSLAAAFAAVGAFPYSSAASKDSGIYQAALDPGAYTVQVKDAGGSAGTTLAEIYDATPGQSFTTSTSRLINVSVLKKVGSGVTAGFVIGGRTTRTVLVRAVGPTLAQYGVVDTLNHPSLTLFDTTGKVIAQNTSWGGTGLLVDAFAKVGAFALPASSQDAAILVTLQPGNYTAQVTGIEGENGTALIEVYEAP